LDDLWDHAKEYGLKDVYLVQFHVLRIASNGFNLVKDEMLKYITRI